MGNAEIEVKDYAKYTTDTNLESGVGKAILRAIAEDLQFYLEKRDIDVRIFIQEKQLGRATRTIVKTKRTFPVLMVGRWEQRAMHCLFMP